jgi:hypothetical protein
MRDRERFPLDSIDVATMEVRAVVNGIDGIGGCHHTATDTAKGYIVSVVRAGSTSSGAPKPAPERWNLLAGCGHAIASPASSRR